MGLQCDCDLACYLLEKLFDQDEAVGGKLSSKRVSLKSSEHWDLKNLFIMSQYKYIPPPPRTYSRISHPLERYLDMLNRGCRKKLFLIGDREHRDDLKTYNEAMLDIDSKKRM